VQAFPSTPQGVWTGLYVPVSQEGHMLYTLLVILLIIVLAVIVWRVVAGRGAV
jgi:hypothetical protein